MESVLTEPRTSGRSTPPLAGRPTRVALVGAGYIAQTHAEVLRVVAAELASAGGLEISAVCDVDAGKAEAFARRYSVPAAFASSERLIHEGRPDAVHVLVPPRLHRAAAEPFLAAGIHVLLEKPLALGTEDARALMAAAQSGGARLGVNHNFTFHPLFLRILADVGAGRIGRVQHVVSVQNNPLRQLAAGDFGNWMFAHPRNIVFEQGPHPLSQLVRLLGPVADAQVTPSGRHDLPGGRVFFDTWQASLRFGAATAQCLLAFGREFPESWLHVIGQDGSIRADLLLGTYTVHGKTRWPDFWDAALNARADAKAARRAAREAVLGYLLPLLKLRPRSDAFFAGMRGSVLGFHRALRDGSALPVSAADGLAVVQACEALTARVPTPSPPPARSHVAAAPRPREVAVLGATGFLGGHLVERLVAEGRPVRILVRNASVLPAHLRHPLVVAEEGSTHDDGALDRALRGVDAVVHLAWGGGDTLADFRRNIVEADERVARACLRQGVRRFLYTSTIAAYYLGPDAPAPVTEETPLDRRPEARGHYARAKVESEERLSALHREKGLPLVVLRPAVVVGARGRPFHSGVGQWPRDTHCLGWGAGTTPIPFVLAGDVADALARALDVAGIEGTSFNLAGDVRLTAREYVDELRIATGRPILFHPTPIALTQASDLFKWLVKAVIRKPENALPSLHDLRSRTLAAPFDCSRAKELLGWRPVADRRLFVDRAIRAVLGPPPSADARPVAESGP